MSYRKRKVRIQGKILVFPRLLIDIIGQVWQHRIDHDHWTLQHKGFKEFKGRLRFWPPTPE